MKKTIILLASLIVFGCTPNEIIDEPAASGPEPFELSGRGLAAMQLHEVHAAVGLSSGNGYDEEYTLDSLLLRPGAGVGPGTKAQPAGTPLREMIRDYLEIHAATRSGIDDLMELLAESGYQLYWPYSEDWDGVTYPVITYDPGYGAESNYGYELAPGPDGAVIVDTLIVDEAMAQTRPVWVVNSNSDAAFTPLELFAGTENSTVTTTSRPRRLMLKSFKMMRNYDSWFGGASEFFLKVGAVEGFSASTDEELKLYSPSITDFMIVVKRRNIDKEMAYEAIMVSDFSTQLDKIAFLIVEDDGGTRTGWKCEAAVKIQSKSYGISLDIPYNEKDDVVWRGQLSARFFEEEDIVTGRFGDVVCSFELE